MKSSKIFIQLSILLGLSLGTTAQADSNEGTVFYKVGYYQQAKDKLKAELQTSADKATVYYYLGNTYFKLGMQDSAAYYYNQGLAADGKNALNAIGLAKLKIKSNPEEAADELKSIQKKGKKDLELIAQIGYAYLDNKEPLGAMEKYDYIYAKSFTNAAGYELLGDIKDFQAQGGEAASAYEQAIANDPTSYDAYIKYARVYSHVNMDVAIQKLQDLKEQAPALSLVDKELSELYYKKNDFENAAKAYADYMKAGSYTVDDLKQYAVTLLMKGDYTKSLEIANKGLAIDPTDPAFCRMEMYNLIELQRTDEANIAADNFFKKSKNPEFSYFDYMYLGRLRDALKSYPEAAAAYMKSYEMDSTRTQLLQLASEAYEKAGDARKSISVLEKFIATTGGHTADNLMELGKKYYSLGTAKDTLQGTVKDSVAAAKKTYLATAEKIFGEVGALEPENYRSFYWAGNAASTLDPEALTDSAKIYYSKALEIVQPKIKEDARYAPIAATCIRYLTVYYYKRYDRNKDEEAKKQCVKYAEQWLEMEPGSQVALQLIAL
ncbi:MAG: tetratricopeptide repeat protein [Bacteroidaceae bacterium]